MIAGVWLALAGSALAQAPVISTQPGNQLVSTGNPAVFSVTASGAGALTYQWYRAGVPLPGATGSTFTLPSATRADAGLYSVVVANGPSLTTSLAGRLSVAPSSYPNQLQVDPGFNPRFEAEGGTINTILPDGSGLFLVSGDFSRLNGVARPGLARVDADFQVDATFVPPASFGEVVPTFAVIGTARVHAVLPDGKILATRALPAVGAYPFRNVLVRLMPNGTVDATFTASAEPQNIARLAVQPDGKILVFGLPISVPLPAGKRYVYRLNTDGTVDPSYAPEFRSSSVTVPETIVVQPDGKAIFLGSFISMVNGTEVSGPVRLTTAGVLDPTFQITGIENPTVTAISVLPDGRLLVGGSFGVPTGTTQLIRVGVNGAWEASLVSGSQVSRSLSKIVQGSDGKIWASANSSSTLRVWRISASGTVEQEFLASVVDNTWAYAPAGSDRLLLTNPPNPQSGNWAFRFAANGVAENVVARLEMPVGVRTVIAAPGGHVFAGGKFTRANGVPAAGLARLKSDGSMDASFTAAPGFDEPSALYLLPNGKLLVGADFWGGSLVSRLVRLNADGSLDLSYDTLGGTNIAVLQDGRVLANGSSLFRTDGTVDPSYQPSLAGVFTGGLQSDGKVIVAATMSDARIIARLLPTGATDLLGNYNGNGPNIVTSMAIQPDGKIIVGGARYLLSTPAQLAPWVARFNTDLSRDTLFATNGFSLPATTSGLYRGAQVLPQEDGRVLVNDYYGFARLKTDGTLDPSFVLSDVYHYTSPVVPSAKEVAAMLLLDDGKILLADPLMSVGGVRRAGLVRFMDAAMPVLATQPLAQAVFAGEAATFSATVSGPGPFTYQWLKNGAAIPGATNASFTVENVGAGAIGSYSVLVTNAGGAVRSSGASLIINPPVAPAIVRPPRAQTAALGQTVGFDVIATGTPLLGYQWRKDGTPMEGKTGSRLTLPAISSSDAGDYSVVVHNGAGSVLSSAARLTLFPSGMNATHTVANVSSQPGTTVTISSTFTYSGAAPALDWEVLLPAGWSVVSTTGDGAAALKPAAGDIDLAAWRWSTPPASPVTFTYTLASPAATRGEQQFAALVTVQVAGAPLALLAQPDPLLVRQRHSAD
ncbi:MAG: immunoglobulin domain-containing protein, partial [Verrucomicrobiota bacterium]